MTSKLLPSTTFGGSDTPCRAPAPDGRTQTDTPSTLWNANDPQPVRLAALQAALDATREAASKRPRYFDQDRAAAFKPFRTQAAATKLANTHKGWVVRRALGGFAVVQTLCLPNEIRQLAYGREGSTARMRDLEMLMWDAGVPC